MWISRDDHLVKKLQVSLLSRVKSPGDYMANHTKVSAAEKLIDLKVAAGEKLAKAEARLNEKVVLTKTNIAVGLHRIIHHEHNERHDRFLDSAAETMMAASGKLSVISSASVS